MRRRKGASKKQREPKGGKELTMTYNILVADRKQVVTKLEELTGERMVYTRMPRCAYILRGIVVEKNGELYVVSKFFLPTEKIQEATAADGLPYQAYIQRGLLQPSGDNFIDYHDCYSWFTDLIEKYQIYPLVVGYDRYTAQYLVQDLKAYGFNMDDVFQGTNLTPVIREFEGLLKDGNIHIGNNDLLKVHMLDSALKMETDTERVKLVKLRKYGHIDGMAALLDAMCVRQKRYEQYGGQLKNEG